MKTKHDYQNEFEYQGVFFRIHYEWPAAIRHKAAPCRGQGAAVSLVIDDCDVVVRYEAASDR